MNSPIVVPAKAGTHTPCASEVAQVSNNGDAAEYGYPPSRGRQTIFSRMYSAALNRHDANPELTAATRYCAGCFTYATVPAIPVGQERTWRSGSHLTVLPSMSVAVTL